ncbi:type VI secretion system tip protein VgrG [Corallococcus sp. AB018]|uniref:type VI secretion system Vgr family protein n=1 Tax=Corallococcus sp. AB018 TaxID=2316715 RepID=UPI000F89AB75|nr:type VI secretion system tip protein VgrG [Corallococcus sp. AB018]RUO91788.1 type VI secretion system tip protein VgrG [Corallococcus sp. AB018]
MDTQDSLYLSIETPLGKDVLLARSFHGEERLCAPFRFDLELHSRHGDLDFTQVVGQGATVMLELPDGTPRYFHGLVTRFIQAGTRKDFTTYFAELRPWLWLLTLTRDSRIHQNLSVPEIVEATFKRHNLGEFRKELKGTYAARDYCVQYQESDFDFVSRLLEDEGIFYFFEHAQGKHTLVLADDASAHAACPGLEQVRVAGQEPAPRPEDTLTECTLEQQVVPTAHAMGDFDFEVPATPLSAEVPASASLSLRRYEYPGGFLKQADGEARVKLRKQAAEAPAKTLSGRGRVRAFTSGGRFTLAEHDRASINGDYVLRQVVHAATDEAYSNSFEAFPADVPFRPAQRTPRPVMVGAQTALVVGKSGEEIWTDKYGRVKVQFHWDQQGQSDENSSCWIRVAQGWAGKSFGSMFLPRVGQEVLITFLEGDPDRPLVTGGIYNAQQTVPYALPENQTRSTLKTQSSKEGDGFNELRFEDKKDEEEVFLQAQKDLNVTVKNARTTTIEEADDTLTVKKGNRVITVETGDETHDVKGKRTLTVTGEESHTSKAKFTHDVGGDYVLTVKGDLTLDVTGAVTIKAGKSLTLKAEQELTVTAGTSLTQKSGTDFTNEAGTSLTNKAGTALTNKAGTNLVNDAGMELTNKASMSQTVDGGAMLTVKGGLVKIN